MYIRIGLHRARLASEDLTVKPKSANILNGTMFYLSGCSQVCHILIVEYFFVVVVCGCFNSFSIKLR